MGISNAIQAELHGAMLAIEIAFNKGWHNLWLECVSQLVVLAFNNVSIVPWKLRNIWQNCIELSKKTRFSVTHIFREGNYCANKIAALGFAFQGFHWWDTISRIISDDFIRNRVSLPNYRFT